MTTAVLGQAPTLHQQTTTDASESRSLLDEIITKGRLARDEEQRALARDLIGELVEQVMSGVMKLAPNTQAMINTRIGQIDERISRELNAILHHPEFQALEASWRGLHYLVHQTET